MKSSNQDNMVIQLTLLYELAMSIGNSKETYQNCKDFVDVMLARKNIISASCWLFQDDRLNRIYSAPELYFNEKHTAYIKDMIFRSHPDWYRVAEDEAKHFIFSLGKIGYFIATVNDESVFNNMFLKQLKPILLKLTNTLRGTMALKTAVTEISKRKLLETELINTNERLNLALEGTKDGTWDWNILTNDVKFSNNWGKMLGYNPDEITHELSFWSDKVHPEDWNDVISKVKNHINGETDNYVSEHRLKTKSGEYKWVLDRGKVLYSESGEAVRMVGTHQDIDKRKTLEIELHELNDRLEDIVKKRTSDLSKSNSELKKEVAQRKKAEEVINNQLTDLKEAYEKLKSAQSIILRQEKLASIGQLAAGVAHELNNPLGFISSNFYVLSKHFEKIKSFIEEVSGLTNQNSCVNIEQQVIEKYKKYKISYILEDIVDIFAESKDGFSRVSGIVDNLLVFARADSGRKRLNDINISIKSTLKVAASELKQVAAIKETLSELPQFEYDAGEINQVLLNLILNAAQAIKENNVNPAGEISIHSYMKNNNAHITITDNGPGIPTEYVNKIFDPFFTTKDIGKGTGLGLNIAYDIVVNKHGGSLDVESKPGKTKFTLSLPLSQEL